MKIISIILFTGTVIFAVYSAETETIQAARETEKAMSVVQDYPRLAKALAGTPE